MNKRVFLFGAFIAAPLWAQGQTQVGTSVVRGRPGNPLDTMRAMLLWRNPTIDEVVAWAGEVARRAEAAKVTNERVRREFQGSDEMRLRELVTAAKMSIEEVQQAQRVLLDACNAIRPHQGESEGVLGFQIEIGGGTAFQQTGPAIREERFIRSPQISFVEPNTPAAKAGVREGDIWVGIGGRDLVNMYVRELNDVLKPDNPVDLKLRRNGRDMNVEVVARKRREYPESACDTNTGMYELHVVGPAAGALPKMQILTGPLAGGRSDFLAMRINRSQINGAVFVEISNEKRGVLNAPLNEGVLVDSIVPGSPAETAGLKAFDVVTRVNNEVIQSVSDFMKAITQASGPLSLWVYTKGSGRKVVLPGR